MEGGGEEDPFGSLIKLCQITSSQESKLQNCPFALESENFPDADDSLPSQFAPTPTMSEPPGIIMVSLPETDSEGDDVGSINKSTPQENEEFQTPPEQHNLSASSSQEDPRLIAKPIAAIDERIDGSDDVETMAVDDGCGENEVSFEFRRRGENLGFTETEALEGQVEGIEGFEGGVKKFRAFDGELDEPASKKGRVQEKNWDSATQAECIGETSITEKVDDDEDEGDLIYLDIDDLDEGIGLADKNTVINVDSAQEEPDLNDGMQKNVMGVSDCGNDSEDVNVEECENGIRKNGNDELLENGDEVSGRRNSNEIEKFKYGGRNGVDNPGKGKGLSGGEKSSLIKGDLVVEASGEGFQNNKGDEVEKNSEEVLGCRNIQDIERFRYNKRNGDSGDQSRNEVVPRKRELPLSLREKGDHVGGKENLRQVDVKNLSWKELLDAASVVLGKVNDGSEDDVDILEAAKRKGMTFPHPRWI